MADNNLKKKGGLLGKLLIAAGACAVLFALAVVLAPRFIPWEKVRQQIEEKGSAALNREVRLKSLSVSLFSGVEITGFRIGPAKGREEPDLVSAGRVVAKYRLLPLLWLQVVVRKIELVEPKLFVGKDAKGQWSFADLMGKAPTSAGGPAKPMTLPIGVDVDSIKVTGGSLEYRDASAKPVFSAGVGKLDVLIRGFSLSGALASVKTSCVVELDGKAMPVEAAGKLGINLNRSLVTLKDFAVGLPGIKATASGEVTQIQVLPTMNLTIHAVADLPAVWAGYAGFIPKGVRDMMSLAGLATVDAKVGGTQNKLSLEGSAVAKAVAVDLKDWPGAFENLEGKISFTEDTVSATDLRFMSYGSPFTFECQIRNLGFAKPMAFDYRKFSPKGKFSAVCPKLVLDKLLPPPMKMVGGEKPKPGAEPPPPPEMDFRGMIPKGVEIEGDARVDELRARKLVFLKEKVHVRIMGETIHYELTDASYGGTQTGSGKVMLGTFPITFEAAGKLTGFQIGRFMDDSLETFVAGGSAGKGRIEGATAADYAISCKGIWPASIRKYIKGTALVSIENGKATKLAFLKGLGKVLKTDMFERDMTFKSLGGHFVLGGGKADTPDFAMDPGPEGDLGLTYKGSIGLEDYALKGEMTTRFHPRNADEVMKGEIGKALFTKDKDGWAVGLWDVKGTLFLPIPTPSTKQLGTKAKAAAQTELKKAAPAATKALRGLFKKKK